MKLTCLDHGYVRLVEHMGSDLSVARSARVSYDAAWRAGEDEGSDAKLIRYLWRHKHSSPFESPSFNFEVKAPIFVFRQWHRHRTWSYNEMSARYTELPEEYYVPALDKIGQQSKSTKQARTFADVDPNLYAASQVCYERHCHEAFATYHALLKTGWPRELARGVLPVATYSIMFAKTNLLNLFKFLTLRLDPHAQYEIQVYAQAMLDLIRPIVPVCVAAWEEK